MTLSNVRFNAMDQNDLNSAFSHNARKSGSRCQNRVTLLNLRLVCLLIVTECTVMITLSKALNFKFNRVIFFYPDPNHVFGPPKLLSISTFFGQKNIIQLALLPNFSGRGHLIFQGVAASFNRNISV